MASDTLRLLAVAPNQVWSTACLYEDHLRGFCGKYPEHSFRSLQARANAEEIQLWLVWNTETARSTAVVGTELIKGDDGRVTCQVLFSAGRNAKHWAHLIDDLATWAAANGAYRILATVRPGFERLFPAGYRRSHVILERPL